eukprot:CAMPEP_0174832670 /NCGR_PEP_ID=MMETSP1114-20130205/3797_1 /TAXON_ID=312471 /ORGANISM="Neobodo designis, Strain CCAP 1951/1" /LENGTH=361 /DNA_ID=CAMNT_0016066533 /DNA_START=79 /DNA_END=1164 /DNA_ORIENTATION=-
MGCTGSSEVVVHPGFAEVLTIQAFVRSEFAAHSDLQLALDYVMSCHRREAQQKNGDELPSLDQLASRVTHDQRVLRELPDAPEGLPEGSVRSNLDHFEAVVARKVRPKVRQIIAAVVPRKHPEEERNAAAENAMCGAIHVCTMQEVYEYFAPKHFATARDAPVATAREAVAADDSAKEYVHDDGAAGQSDDAAGAHGDQTPLDDGPRHSDPNHGVARTPTADHDDNDGDNVETPPRDDQPASEPEPQPAEQPKTPTHAEEMQAPAPASPPTDAPASDAPPTADAEAEEEELRYPLPDGDWVRSEDNPDFWWSDEQGLFYFPAAGHFMDPESGMWYVAETDEWLSAEDHDQVLAEMAERGDY